MEQSTRSSKVTVEYTDPSGIYPVISSELQKHLPLRNLYWNSATRPLRSIASLHINLIKAGTEDNATAATEPSDASTQDGATKGGSYRDAPHGTNQRGSGFGAKKERRHQIPGLRQTPYLKIFFLQCSDVESYRITYRGQIREWIKENTPPSQSTALLSSQEFHDAFEWLIVHVVLPDGGRSISRASNTAKIDLRNGYRGSDSVVEKVRGDFNGTSKTAVDRVAQVRIRRDSERSHATDLDQDPSAGWAEFISKAKSLILRSFDLRVTQYEEDIRERDAQRNIPGWNFNTFFVLKEGLAQGFESVGLVEDALTGYQELAAGLSSIIESGADNVQQANHFKNYTDDIAAQLKRALQSDQVQPFDQTNGFPAEPVNEDGGGTNDQLPLGSDILDTDRKPFRELILANEISLFDFRCYLFAREVALLLRLANVSEPAGDVNRASSTDVKTKSADVAPQVNKADTQDLLLLAEVCRRALDFFASASRLLRDDLRSSIDPLSKVHATPSTSMYSSFEGPIEDLVASWVYSACQCILNVTNVPSLNDQLQTLLRTLKPSDEASSGSRGSATAVSRGELPRRTSSLPMHAQRSPRSSTPDGLPAIISLDAMKLLPPTSQQNGTQVLAAQRAELVTLERRILAGVSRRSSNIRINHADLPDSPFSSNTDMEEVSLDDTTSTREGYESGETTIYGNRANSLQNRELKSNLSTENAYSKAYENLTTVALALNVVSGKRRSAESLMADLAVIRYLAKDYGSAASYFHQIASFYRNNDWTRLEIPMLDMYARSLKYLDREQDFIRIGLQILARTTYHSQRPYALANEVFSPDFGEHGHYLQDIINASKTLERPLSAPLNRHFGEVFLDPYIHHFEGTDGFCMSLKLHSQMSTAFEAHEIRVKLVNVDDEQLSSIWLTMEAPELLQRGPNHVVIQTTVTCTGWYRLERVEVRSEKISFVYDTAVPTSSAFFGASPTVDGVDHISEANSTPILIWPDEKALQARISLYRAIHLGQPTFLEIKIRSGQNNIDHGRINLRACSAGLRLYTANAEAASGNDLISDKPQAGCLGYGALEPNAEFSVIVPYGLESDLTEIKVKAEVSYTVAGKDYLFVWSGELSIQLQLSVNVQDSFQERALFSTFKIGTANSVPARIKDYSMDGTKAYKVALPPSAAVPLDIFPRQPLSLVAKIQREASNPEDKSGRTPLDSMLMLQISYACLDQEIGTAVEDALLTALRESKFHGLSRLLVSSLTKTLQSKLSAQDFDSIGLLRKIHLLPFEEYRWDSVLAGLHPEKRAEIQPWLAHWHVDHPTIKLPQEVDTRNILHLVVPVEIPQIPVVVTARLHVLGCMTGPGAARVATVDQSLVAEASFQYSCYWAKGSDTLRKSNMLDVTYEFQANQDVWLIGGQRKAHYSAEAGEIRKFPIILLPQKTGHLQYPSLDIRITRAEGDKRRFGDTIEVPKDVIACETDYLNQSDSVLIIPNLTRSTVSLDSTGPGDRAWLLESSSR